MYTQTLYELIRRLNACYSFLANSCSYWKKCLSLYPETMRHNGLLPRVSLYRRASRDAE